jgi:hypothetical protein
MWNSIKANYPLKIAAIIIAAFIWFYVVTDNEYKVSIKIPITFTNIEKGLFVSDNPESAATVSIRGTGKSIIRLKLFGNPHIEHNLSRYKRGWRRVTISKEDVCLPYGVKLNVVSIESPQPFLIHLDKYKEDTLKVVPSVSLPHGYRMKVIPQSCIARGGMDKFRHLKGIKTEKFVIDSSSVPETLLVKLAPPNGITTNPESVKIIIKKKQGGT